MSKTLRMLSLCSLALLASAAAATASPTSPPPAAASDPTRIWHIETAARGNDLWPGLEARGLAIPFAEEREPVNKHAFALVRRRIVERVREVYGQRPDGISRPGLSFALELFVEDPDPLRFPRGPGYDHSRICVGGKAKRCGGTLGVERYDPGNSYVEYECAAERLGVFAGRICGVRSQLSPHVERSDLRFVDGRYRLGQGSRRDDARFLEVHLALSDWGTALGNVTAHEIGHALGLDHDRRRGHVMEARISPMDLSSRTLDLSPASRSVLERDVGYAAAAPAREVGIALESDVSTTLGALSRSAETIVLVGPAGAAAEVLKGRGEREALDAVRGERREGFVFVGDGEASFVEAQGFAEREAIRERILGYLGGGPRPFVAEGLRHWSPRIATDAVIELVESGGAPEAEEAELVEAALLGDVTRFEDVRPLVVLAGRARRERCRDRILDLAVEDGTSTFAAVAGEALAALGAAGAIADRLARSDDDGARAALMEAQVAAGALPALERAALLADRDERIAAAAARSLLLGGPDERAVLLAAAPRLAGRARERVEELLRRPRA